MIDSKNTKKLIGEIFLDIADSIEKGSFAEKISIGLTTLGSEHKIGNLVKGAELASKRYPDVDIILIGPQVETHLKVMEANTEKEMYSLMEKMLDEGSIQACVTMHYSFPVGVSTVGKVVTPGLGKEMFIATTTGTTATNRVEAMVKNTINGIIAAKASGINNPSIGILNLDGSKQVEIALKKLNTNGYKINFGESIRADGGLIMRGNDLLTGSVDVMITDTLTGNILMKMFSSFTTGGNYEASGYGYGPGIGENCNRNILILSRASGSAVVANAIEYGASVSKGKILVIAKNEYDKAKKAGLNDIISELNKNRDSKDSQVESPDKEVVTFQISGIDVMDLEDAVNTLWKESIYAESGMGCTGPIVLVSEKNSQKSMDILEKNDYIVSDKSDC